ncbi:LANO_0C04984g1_1 [Lachancea nothofagi CBS 11611]|uniref:LANO_0C04984g1_1 n=1 Tax=Lachancea nothofagi CBS 11611 TaxID=1266666 RepID=A0A1G4J728_9SACH|nr:LANO_0C04984g1_1 [Lachancea nothofagi CBS 11611]
MATDLSSLNYNSNSKLLEVPGCSEDVEMNIQQINKLTQDLVAENNPNFTPQPHDDSTSMIKKLFESGLKNLQQQKMAEALKSINLAIEMAQRKRAPWEAFAVQLQELQFMLKNRVDLSLIQGKFMDGLQDLDFLQNTGLNSSDVFIRKTDALMKLKQYELARSEVERGLSLDPTNIKLKSLHIENSRRLAEYNGDI